MVRMIKFDDCCIIASIVIVLLVTAYLWTYSKKDFIKKEHNIYIATKKSENTTRLHQVPIILYHNIDGKGPYSIPYNKLEGHFLLLKEHSIKVISLQQMETHIDTRNPFSQKVVSITFDDGYYTMYSKLLPLAQSFDYPITLFVYIDAIGKKGTKILTWEMLVTLQKNNIDIQCHSLSHPDLVAVLKKGTIESRYQLYHEMYLSKRVLELYLNKKIEYFAFPYGRYSIELTELCRDAGFTRVFSTDYGPNIITKDNYCLRRHHIKSDYSDKKVLSLAL